MKNVRILIKYRSQESCFTHLYVTIVHVIIYLTVHLYNIRIPIKILILQQQDLMFINNNIIHENLPAFFLLQNLYKFNILDYDLTGW